MAKPVSKRLTVNEVKALVRRGISLSPESAQVLIDRIEELNRALMPFANHGIGNYASDTEEIRAYDDGSGPTNLTVGQIRRAGEVYQDANLRSEVHRPVPG